MSNLFVVLTTEENELLANYLAKELLKRKLAACVSMSLIKSSFWWKGEINESQEVQLLIKTTKDKLDELLRILPELHSYQIPEILYWNLSASFTYGKWAENSISSC